MPAKPLNAILFQLGWFCCVLGGNWLALLALLLMLLIHFFYVMTDQREWLLIIAVTVIGVIIDSILTFFTVLQFEERTLAYIPFWLMFLWCFFATSLRHSLSWLRGRLLLASIVGAAAGASSYYAGSRLGSVSFGQPLSLSLIYIGICWAILLPLLIKFTYWLD
mgnify:CR=1 FL=1